MFIKLIFKILKLFIFKFQKFRGSNIPYINIKPGHLFFATKNLLCALLPSDNYTTSEIDFGLKSDKILSSERET